MCLLMFTFTVGMNAQPVYDYNKSTTSDTTKDVVNNTPLVSVADIIIDQLSSVDDTNTFITNNIQQVSLVVANDVGNMLQPTFNDLYQRSCVEFGNIYNSNLQHMSPLITNTNTNSGFIQDYYPSINNLVIIRSNR